MFRYQLAEPNYRPFPYEELMARHELAALSDGKPVVDGSVETHLQAGSHILRRIAFSACVTGGGIEVPTDIARLEKVTNQLKNGKATRKQSHYLTHGLHSFKGKFYPQLARALLNRAKVLPGDFVLDPFCWKRDITHRIVVTWSRCTRSGCKPSRHSNRKNQGQTSPYSGGFIREATQCV